MRLSRLALLFERVWEALLWPFFVVATFLVVTLLDLWSITPPLAPSRAARRLRPRAAVSFLPLIRYRLPTREEALRRLERKANIKHRPASSYEDRLGAIPAKETALLWAAHRERLCRLIQKLKPTWPEPRTDRKDPYAIRALLLVALIAAVLAAGPNGLDRLRCRLLSGREQRPVAAQARCLGDAAGLYRGPAHRACRRQRDGRRGLRDLPRAVGA